MSKTPSGPPVSRPPVVFDTTECGGISPVAELTIILALLVMRRVIGAAPVSRPARTQKISDHYGIAKPDELSDVELGMSIVNDAELGKSIVLTVALPAFAIGCLVGMLLL
jgi:hypothetical protein